MDDEARAAPQLGGINPVGDSDSTAFDEASNDDGEHEQDQDGGVVEATLPLARMEPILEEVLLPRPRKITRQRRQDPIINQESLSSYDLIESEPGDSDIHLELRYRLVERLQERGMNPVAALTAANMIIARWWTGVTYSETVMEALAVIVNPL